MNTARTPQRWVATLSTSFMLVVLATCLSAQISKGTHPEHAASYTLMANGENMGTFKHVSMPNHAPDVIEEREFDREAEKKHLGKSQPGKIILSQGEPQSTQNISMWYRDVTQGNMAKARRKATLILRASDGKQVARYELNDAWPAKITKGNGVETLELEYESIKRLE